MKININPSFFSIDSPWKTILDQEGLHWEIINKDLNHNACIIISDDTAVSFDLLENYVKSGGLLLISSFKWKKITNSENHKKKVSFLIPKKSSPFSSIDFIEINHEVEYPKNKSMFSLDDNLFIFKYPLGSGCIIIHPFNLKKNFCSTNSRRKNFYDTRIELPSEMVANVTKSKIRKTLFLCLKYLYDFKKLPIVRSNYNPANYNSIFCFRIDSDFSSKKNAKKINALCEKYSIPATWFIETSSKKIIQNVYKNFNTSEFAFHNDRHIIFNNLYDNNKNIETGLNKLKNLNINNLNGFAAPFGDWNVTLNEALEDKFSYSSEFTYDYDNFPSYPIINGNFSKVLQIPVHPISIGRLNRSHYSKYEMVDYYLNIIKKKYLQNEPILIYYHPNNKFFSVIETVFKEIKLLDIKIMTMYDYYNFWIKRILNKPNCSFNNNTIIINNSSFNVEILFNKKSAVIHSKKEINLSNIKFNTIKKNNPPKDIKKIKKKTWRNLLYDFERYNAMRKM